MGVSEIVSTLFDELRPSSASGLSIRTLVDLFTGSALDTAFDGLVATHPQIASRIVDGIRLDYGLHFVDPAGNMITGSAEVTCPEFNAGISAVTATCGVTFDGYTENGSATQVDWLQWGVDLALGPGDQVTGDVTVTGGTLPKTTKPEPASVTGSAHFDTVICATYPITGSIAVTIGGETTMVDFGDACDGTYTLGLPAPEYWALTLSLYGCTSSYSAEISLVEENGVLTVDQGISPWNDGVFGCGRWRAGGWINDSEVYLQFSASANPDAGNPNVRPGVSGTFHGHKSKLFESYYGEVTYTITELPTDSSPAVEEACTVTHTNVRDGHNYIYSCMGDHCR